MAAATNLHERTGWNHRINDQHYDEVTEISIGEQSGSTIVMGSMVVTKLLGRP